jgi:endonuclease YncB( thermonuclease family)
MRTTLVLFAVVLASVPAAAAEDPCGNAMLVSQGYMSLQGTVLDVLDPVTLLVEVRDVPAAFHPEDPHLPADSRAVLHCSGKPCKVRLVNLDPPGNPGLGALAKRNLLKRLGASKRVNLSISPVQDTPGVVNALVTTDYYQKEDWLHELNKAQLEAGLAAYRDFGPYAVDWYIECKLRRGEAQARQARRGLWAKP